MQIFNSRDRHWLLGYSATSAVPLMKSALSKGHCAVAPKQSFLISPYNPALPAAELLFG